MRTLLALFTFTIAATSQTIFYHSDSNPAVGNSNTLPWTSTTGFSSLHVYTAAQILASGVAPGSVLTDFAIAPIAAAATGTYNAPTARMLIGHLLTGTIVPNAWAANLDNPTVVHDPTMGPYTFPWASSTWTSLPGFSAAAFTWDGVRDVGVFYTSSPGTTGGFSIRTPGLNPRCGITTYDATTQTPTTTGYFAMKARMTFTGQPPQANTNPATLLLNGTANPLSLYGNDLLTINVTSSTAAGQPFFVFLAPSFTGGHLPLVGESFELGASNAFFTDVIGISPAGAFPLLTGPLQPFAALDNAGNFTLPIALGCPFATPRLFLQIAIVDPSNVNGIGLSGLGSFDAKAACRFTSSTAFPLAIPDAGAPVTATITIPPGTLINDIDVLFQMNHPNYSDISMTLDHNGTTIPILIPGPSDTSDLNGTYQLTDEAPITLDSGAVLSGTTILPGRFIPDSALAAFDGVDAGGIWTLTITDVTATNVGALQSFAILLNGAE